MKKGFDKDGGDAPIAFPQFWEQQQFAWSYQRPQLFYSPYLQF